MDETRDPSLTLTASVKTVNINGSDSKKRIRTPSKQRNWTGRVSRVSISPGFNATPKPLVNSLLPTFQLEPKTRPSQDVLVRTLQRVVDSACQNRPMERFVVTRVRRFCSSLAREIQAQVTGEEYDRYRVLVKVIMVERTNQTGVSKMGFIWEADKDMWSNYVKYTRLFVLNATVCVVYWD